MSSLIEIEHAIEGLNSHDRAKLAQWWQERFDSDEGLEVCDEIRAELDLAKQEIARGEVADWEQLKRSIKAGRR